MQMCMKDAIYKLREIIATCRCRRIVSHSAAVVRQETSPLREAHPGRWLMTHNSTADLPAVSSCQIPPLGLDSELDYSGWSPRI